MAIVKGFWHFLVGVKDFLVLLLMVLIFALIITARSAEGDAPGVPDGGVLNIPLSGFLVTQATEISPIDLLSGAPAMGETETRELISIIEIAKDDDRIAAIHLDLDGFLGGGQADIQAVSDALADFRSADKKVTAYATAYFDGSWLMAAHADEVWLNPLGQVLIGGPGGSRLYFADALEQLKINVNVFRVGTYKSFVEPYTRSEASPEAEAAIRAVYEDIWGDYQQDAQAARPAADLTGYIANMGDNVRAAGGDFAQAAMAAGLIDRVGTRTALGDQLAETYGRGDDDQPGLYASIDYADYLKAKESLLGTSGDAVGIIYVAGTIVDGEAPAGTAGGATIAALIEDAVADEDVKSIVVRIDSGGGSVTASEDIRQALLTAKAEGIPIVASFGNVAASGGYWVATAADQIIAQPSTITGSIGVFGIIPSFERTLADLGVNADGIQTTPYSGAPDIFAGLNPETKELFQLGVEDVYRRFIAVVGEARGLDAARVDAVGQGRVWSGGAARQLGLVDRFGNLDDAIAVAEELAGFEAGELRVKDIETPPPFPIQFLENFMTSDTDADRPRGALDLAVRRARMAAAGQLGEALGIATGPTVQATCLECSGLRPAAHSNDIQVLIEKMGRAAVR
ncbi:signal peptide peptidase SppA [Pacificimonas sp. WHA3]|uniref:Signal peptide peptidase SppA n=1 Tax=Pacificimonas pallii TaxID=2827236 RepID=A0ABS6SHN3_9SPHN|nr:signal peptide peptidase SppA [Pacificimonas pallii]MBV7257922.1 signal peptide peptidase SppA [Pacificimonas pallii]